MTSLLNAAVEWLAASGAPNWIVLVAFLTSPWKWSNALMKRVAPLLDGVLPGGE